MNSSGALWKIPTDLPTDFTGGIIPSVISLVKNDTLSFFFLCFKFFSHCNFLSIYRGNISVGKIPWKFTNENIPLIFLFVFIDFLVVSEGNVPPVVSLHLIFALNKGLLGLQPFIRFLVLVMFPSCCCMSRLPIVMRRLSLLPMKLKQGSETPFMDVLHIFLLYL